MKLPVHRIIPFSNVEGIGNRTAIFVQGCNVNCLYCHNSELIPMDWSVCTSYTVGELFEKVKENMPFIRGITVSGGEPTLYHGFLTAFFDQVHQLGLTCYVDTNGFFDREKISDLIASTDKFLFDIKGMGEGLERLCFSNTLIEGVKNGNINSREIIVEKTNLENLKYLLSLDKVEEVRLVYVKGFYDEEEVIEAISGCLKEYPDVPLKIIRAHVRGLPKERIHLLKHHIPSKPDVEQLKSLAHSKGIQLINHIL